MKIAKTLCITVFFALWVCAVSFVCPVQAQNVKLGGTINVDLFGGKQKDTNTASDLKLDELALSFEVELNEHVSANAVVKYEYDDPDYRLFVDEAYITLNKLADQPVNVTAGKWALPFGVFNSHLINDPLTQDAYEINAPGVSLAFAPEQVKGLELSATLYSNRGNRFAGDPNDPATDPNTPVGNNLGNYILNVTMKPVEFLEASVYFVSEQGLNGERNDSLGGSLSATYLGLTLDAEYIGALQREGGSAKGKESAYSVAAAYELLPVLEVAARYEGYDDGVRGNQKYNELEGLEYRVSVGANYELYENTKLMAEYRRSELEDSNESVLEEWTLRLAVDF